MTTIRLTVGQAVVKFLANQYSEQDGQQYKLIEGMFGIFGHGNVAGVGQALMQAELENPDDMPYYQARNEQGAVHAAVAYARVRNRVSTLAVTASIGPGSTNLLTGAALATVNRLPVLLFPSDIFATRVSAPVLQELESPAGYDVTVNDAFRPVSAFFDRVWRPEQLPAALLGAMRVLTDPAATGAVTVALPQDVQAESHDWPEELFAKRVWRINRPRPDSAALAQAVELIRAAKKPLIVAGGGVMYSGAQEALAEFSTATGIPVGQSQAGKGAMVHSHPLCLGAVGSTGSTAANRLAAEADLVIGIGTRYSDFTTASRTAFAAPGVKFVNINIASLDAVKHSGVGIQADARETLVELGAALTHDGQSHTADADWTAKAHAEIATWNAIVDEAYARVDEPLPAQSAIIGAVNDAVNTGDVMVCAAGSMPGDLHKLWRPSTSREYHVEYGFSCMGYEVAGGMGISMALASLGDDNLSYVMVGDGSYLMMAQELVTAVAEGIPMIVVLVQNHGFASIGALSESLGSQRFGTQYRYRDGKSGRIDGEKLPVDLALNAESMGVRVLRSENLDDFRTHLVQARELARGKSEGEDAGVRGPVMVHINSNPLLFAPDSESWWDVPVADVSTLESTQAAYVEYTKFKEGQRHFL